MKQLLRGLGAAAVLGTLLFASCKKDDDNNNDATIVGRWRLAEEHFREVDSNFTPPHVYSEDTTFSASNPLVIIEFRSNNTVRSIDRSSMPADTSEGAYQLLSGSKMILREDGSSMGDTVSYSLSGNSLHFTYDESSGGIHYTSDEVLMRY